MPESITVRLPGAVFVFDNINYKGGGMDAVVGVLRESPTDPLAQLDYDPERVFRYHLSGRSLSNVTAYRRELEKFHGDDLDWTRLLHEAIRQAEKQYVSEVRSLDPWGRADEIGGDLVAGVFPMNRVSVVFGMGGSGKSLIVESAMAAASTGVSWMGRNTVGGNVLWLDYENEHEGDFGARREALAAGGLEFMPGSVRWMAARGLPMTELVEPVRAEMEKFHCDRFVLDSAAFAIPDALKAEHATQFYGALARLPVSTKVLIAHTDKAENDKYPFGSIFWHNGIHGMSWYVKGVEKDNTLTVAWYNRKASNGPKPHDFAVKLVFDDEGISLEQGNLQMVTKETGKGSVSSRILAALGEGSLKPAAIATAIKVDLGQVSARLGDLRDAKKVTKLADGTYGLCYDDSHL